VMAESVSVLAVASASAWVAALAVTLVMAVFHALLKVMVWRWAIRKGLALFAFPSSMLQ